MTVHKLSRREALRGTGVAALAAGVAVVPLVAVAMPPRDPAERIKGLLVELKAAMLELHPNAHVEVANNEKDELERHGIPHAAAVFAWFDDPDWRARP